MKKSVGGVVIIVVIILLILMVAFGAIFSLIIFGSFRGGKLDKPIGLGGREGGCTMTDSSFSDTSIADEPDEVIKTLKSKYGDKITKVEKNVREVLAKGKQMRLNPAIVIGMWNGESSFREDLLKDAFGFGNTDAGSLPGTSGWEAELNGVYSRLAASRDKSGVYVRPEGEDMLTRLWYNYSTALKLAYDAAGGKWVEGTSVEFQGRTYDDPVGSRLGVIRMLVPSQVVCNTLVAGVSSGGSTYTGDGLSTCPNVTPHMLPVNKDPNGTPRVIIMHYLGSKGVGGDQVFTADDMYQLSLRGIKGQDSRVVYVHYVVTQSGKIEQQYPENRSGAGAAGYNQPTSDYGAGAISLHIENEGHFESRFSNLQYTQAQLQANIELVKCLQEKFSIAKNDVISHKEADRRQGVTGRRSDPGEEFMKKIMNAL
ncbi:N-acetylmuramoyl-L-alanine amidase [Candidatus Berkelbacteria bacterium]|nr:N-acetylmuramoyl-L-alanine amidase [Candidatus Berkelbacteria bacterium]